MVNQIPGFFYDPLKKKYFKIDKNSTGIHDYTSNSLKHKRDEELIDEKISKLKLTKYDKFPYLQDQLLSLQSKLKYTSLSVMRDGLFTYRLSQMQRSPIDEYTNLFNDGTRVSIPYDCDRGIVIGYDRAIKCIPNREAMDHYHPTTISYSQHSMLRNIHVFDQGFIYTSVGTMNEPSKVRTHIRGTINTIEARSKELFHNSINDEFDDSIILATSKGIRSLKYEGRYKELLTKGDVICLDSKDAHNLYIGYRNGKIASLDKRVNKNSIDIFRKPRGGKSVINIKNLDLKNVLCSTLGSKLTIYDVRMGLNELRSFDSIKNTTSIYEEKVQVLENHHFMVQTKKSIEFFDTEKSTPIKTLSTKDNDGYFFDSSVYFEKDMTLYTFEGSKASRFE